MRVYFSYDEATALYHAASIYETRVKPEDYTTVKAYREVKKNLNAARDQLRTRIEQEREKTLQKYLHEKHTAK